jgi:hypothetical protein
MNKKVNEDSDRKLTEEELKDVSSFLENILQDSVVLCENDCCKDIFTEDYVSTLALKLVTILSQDSYITPTDTEAILKQKIKNLTETVDGLLSKLRFYEQGDMHKNGVNIKNPKSISKEHFSSEKLKNDRDIW